MKIEHSKSNGFTLIELTLVTLILAILTVLGIPSFRSLYERTESQRVAAKFIGVMRYAQQRAIMERIPIRVVIDVDKKDYWVPVEEEKERKHYTSRSHRRRTATHRSNRRERIREVKEITASLPSGFIFEFVYKVANDKEYRRGEGEFYFYPDGTADAGYITILRLANSRERERRVFMKIVSTTGLIKSREGTTDSEGSDFYRGYYDEQNLGHA